MKNLREKKQIHLLLNKQNYQVFRNWCAEHFTTPSAEVNKFMKKLLEEGKSDD